jgi:uncharacterized protein (TIGR02147 family)
MKSIFDYSDYRNAIKDYYEEQKKVNPSFSFRYMSMRAGVKSSAFFKLVMEGKRNLSKTTVLQTANLMKLSKEEAAFFENLVFFNQADTIEQKNHYFEKMVETQKRNHVSIVNDNQMNYFAEWFHPVIRELVVMPWFTGDYEALAQKLKPAISAKQAEASVHLLVKLGFLKRIGSQFVQAEPSLHAGSAVSDFLLIQYQIKLLKMAAESFDRFLPPQRMSSATTFAVSHKNLKSYIQKIRDFRSQLQELAEHEKDADQVFNLNMIFFPLSQKV